MTSLIYEVLFFNHRRCFSLYLRYSIIYVNNFCFFLHLFSLSLVWFSWYIIFYITTTAPHFDVTMTSYPTQQNIEASSQLPASLLSLCCFLISDQDDVITSLLSVQLLSVLLALLTIYHPYLSFVKFLSCLCVRKYIWCSSKTLLSAAALSKNYLSLSNCNKFYINILYCL